MMVYVCEACLLTHRKPLCPKCHQKSKSYPNKPSFLSEVLGVDIDVGGAM